MGLRDASIDACEPTPRSPDPSRRERSGRRVTSEYNGESQASLFMTLLDGLGVDVATYGDEGTGPLGGLG
jgi:hypothetical protein